MAVAVAEFFMTQSNSPVAERHFMLVGKIWMVGECLHAPWVPASGQTQAQTRDYSHQNVVSSNDAG